MADFKKYLYETSGQINLSLMDPARRARLEQLKILGTGWEEQLSWDPNTEMPDPSDPLYNMLDADWEKLYMSIQTALRDLGNDPKLLTENKDAKALFADFYGATKIIKDFEPSTTATGIIDPVIANFATYISDPTIKVFLAENIDSDDLDKVIYGLTSIPSTYKSNYKILQNIQRISATVINGQKDGTLPKTPDLTTCGISIGEFYTIYENITKQEPPQPVDRDAFKNTIYTGAGNSISPENILLRLIQKPEALNAFIEKDNSGIGSAIANGIKSKNYKEGKFELVQMDENSLNTFQKATVKVDHIKNDMLGKLTMRHKRHPYYKDETAKPIMESLLIKQKFDMTKGLDEFLSKVESIKGDLKANSPKAVPDLEWFEKSLKSIKGSLPNEFKGALKDGANMNGIINALINRAESDNEWDKLYTALECIAMMRYSLFTSATKNAIIASPFVLLGDPGLSWNKHESMKFVSTAFDRASKLLLSGTVLGATAIHNKIKTRKLKFKNGTEQVKLMHNAEEYLRINPTLNEADLVAELNTAKTNLETLYKSPDTSEKKVKTAEKAWKQAEMNLETFRQKDPTIIGPDKRKPDSILTKKQDAMAFWNYINTPGKSGSDWNILRDGRRAQNKNNLNKTVNFADFANKFYSERVAA